MVAWSTHQAIKKTEKMVVSNNGENVQRCSGVSDRKTICGDDSMENDGETYLESTSTWPKMEKYHCEEDATMG